MRIAVIDGQGGGIGKAIVERFRQKLEDSVEIVALGTNSLATSLMLKAGADEGATGENAIIHNACRVDIILGPIGIISANSLLGELTPLMAKAIAESPAKKILIPMSRCNVTVAGIETKPIPNYIDDALEIVKAMIKDAKNIQ
jgi:NAD(P)-dependent dehydrogenase (short-subunit alcohol dehydrogenase family)